MAFLSNYFASLMSIGMDALCLSDRIFLADVMHFDKSLHSINSSEWSFGVIRVYIIINIDIYLVLNLRNLIFKTNQILCK